MNTLMYQYLRMRNILRKEEGQSLAEYGLIIALVAAGAILALTAFGETISTFLGDLGGRLTVPAG